MELPVHQAELENYLRVSLRESWTKQRNPIHAAVLHPVNFLYLLSRYLLWDHHTDVIFTKALELVERKMQGRFSKIQAFVMHSILLSPPQ